MTYLQKVSSTRSAGSIRPRTRVNPQTDGRGRSARDSLGRDAQAVREDRSLGDGVLVPARNRGSKRPGQSLLISSTRQNFAIAECQRVLDLLANACPLRPPGMLRGRQVFRRFTLFYISIELNISSTFK
jgi:hypothetical protein